MKHKTQRVLTAITTLLLVSTNARAAEVPLVLPRPDGKSADMTKPVKVYILAGQSNMVGFGMIDGAQPAYKSILLSPDPALIAGEFEMGNQANPKIDHCKIYQTEGGDESGAKVAVYAGAYDAKSDYQKLKPALEAALQLGTFSDKLPSIEGPSTIVATGFLEVPDSGTYSLHPGYQSSSRNITTLDGKVVYRKTDAESPTVETIELEAGKRYPFTITYLDGGSAAFWMEQTGLVGHGDLKELTLRDKKFPGFVDADGNWTKRNDVTYIDTRFRKEAGGVPLGVTVNGDGKYIGPEIPFGYVMGTFHDEQVLLIESSNGNRALYWDFRPPSSGRPNPDSEWEGLEYRLLVEGVKDTLKNIDKIVPGYRGQGYEIAGFAWWQGHKDKDQAKAQYEENLVNLIQDLRKDLNAPKMMATIATVGFHGWDISPEYLKIHEAQMAVGDPKQHPEFAGEVASIDTRGYWRPAEKSPTNTYYHYNHNAETYSLVGDAMGRAMVRLHGGSVEMPPKLIEPTSTKPKPAKPEPTEKELAAHLAAMEPMIVDGMLATKLGDKSIQEKVVSALTQKEPGSFNRQSNQFINDTVDDLVHYYQIIGNDSFDWHEFGPVIRNGEWDYFSFDPPEKKDLSLEDRFRKVTLPKGMENWMAPDFNSTAAGWKTGKAPFGQLKGELKPLSQGCSTDFCGCNQMPGTLWENEVLLMRKTLEVPKLKEGHRYRIVIGGSTHVNSGEGFELYANGKLIAKSDKGVGKRMGDRPRGSMIYQSILEEFDGKTVTLALKSFMRYNHPRSDEVYPRGHISVWIQEQKIPEPLLQMLK